MKSALPIALCKALLLITLSTSPSVSAAMITVDAAGHADFKSINAAIAKAGDGDTLLVKPGTYRESVRPKSHMRIVSEKGPVQTSIFVEHGGRGLFLEKVEDVVVEGFDIHSVLGTGKPGDGLVNIVNSTHVTVRDCYIHDAPNDADCVKVSDTRRLLLERCCIWNPARRAEGQGFQEGMDTRVRDFEITVRGCWFFQTEAGGDTLIYCKGGCFDILWEDNIFGPSVGRGFTNVPVQSGHQNAGEWREYKPPYPSGRFVVRNNLFVGLKGEAAFGFQGPDTSLLYNNVFYRNETTPSLITITDNPGAKGGPALNLFCFNNIFASNGDRLIYRQRNAPASLVNLKCSNNLYSQTGGGGDVKINAESGAILNQEPSFVAPSVPAFKFEQGTEQIRRAREGFQLAPSSPARGAGTDPLILTGAVHPNAIPDMRNGIEGASKPAKWDVGLHDFSSSRTSASRLPDSKEVFNADKLAELDAAISQAVTDAKIVGAALWVEHGGTAYHRAFGNRALKPVVEPMTEDTVFDIASVTKVVATASAAMLCVERGWMGLDDPVAKHLPEFTGEGREKITVRHLLLHTSGLQVNLNGTKPPFSRTPAEARAQACREKPLFEPGSAFAYSSTGTMVLGMVIEQVSGRKLDEFCTAEIFKPLKMNDTQYRPSGETLKRVAPTSAPQRGLVDDTVAREMGGVSGHASLFTTAGDLARFARMMLNNGELDGTRLFKPETLKLMTSVQSPPDLRSPDAKNLPVRRALGWDIDTPYRTPPHDYSLARGAVFPVGSFGHTGWTGQMLWIDPFSKTFVIFLCNRYGPEGKDTRADVYRLHHRISTLAAEALKGIDFKSAASAPPKP